jgi:hypothetical protein
MRDKEMKVLELVIPLSFWRVLKDAEDAPYALKMKADPYSSSNCGGDW